MNLHIDVQAFLSTLPIMFYGMVGGIAVMAMLWLALAVLYAVAKRMR